MRSRSTVSVLVSTLLFVAALVGVCSTASAQPASQIFTDGFESGDVSRWSAAREQRPGSLAVTPEAAMNGSDFGLEIAGGGRAWVLSRDPDREREILVSFFFSENNWEMLVRARVDILRFYAQGRRHHLRLVLQQASPGVFRLGLLVRGNRGGYQLIGSGEVRSGEETLVEVEWQAASSRNATDGSATLLINGFVEAREPTLANGRLDVRSIQLGILGGNVGATRGDLIFDDYASFRTLAP